MRKYFIFLSIFFVCNHSFSQFQQNNINLRKKIFQQKAQNHQQIMLCDLQKTPNQEDYDVKYYSLDLIPDTATSVLYGIVEVKGEIVSATLDHIELNFYDGMLITSLYNSNSPGIQLNYNRANDILSVTLDRIYNQGENFRITIEYYGRPQDSSEYGWAFGFDIYENEPMIWSLSQPWGARAWWPCKDVPSDKADSVDIRVTVPNNLIVASNGSLKETTTSGNSTTYRWHEKYPIATYLVSLAIYPYEVYYDDYLYNNGTDTMKIHFYSFQGNYNQYYSINTKVKDMIAYFAGLFGEYPFVEEKYGHAEISIPYGGMEHQTCTSVGVFTDWFYAHELAHQWWGDMITYNTWHHTWIGEGLGTYSEALWYEHEDGAGEASTYQMTRNLYYGPGTVYVEDPGNENPFDINLLYSKASWIFHMLRHIVGDSIFFDILKTFHFSPQHQYGTAITEDFIAICKQVSGINLDKFFHQWLHEEYFPQYSYSWQSIQNGSNYDIQLDISQEQSNYMFWMPIDVTITTVDYETTLVVWDSLQIQSFQLTVSSEPIGVTLDKNNWILKRAPEPIVNPTFDQGILLVNGVSFDVYGSEIWNAYENKVFRGNKPVSFWDCFSPPVDGYPSTLPEPMGHGRIPASILGQFSTVIWVGNNYLGDINSWLTTSIMQYLQAGGNLILMTRKGQDFINEELRQYLGISWEENPVNTINDCISTYSGLQNLTLTGSQTSNAVFNTSLTSNESTLLFQETSSFTVQRGLGIWHKPAAGGTNSINGGQFVFISGRPYRFAHSQLRSNIEYILDNFFKIQQINVYPGDTDNNGVVDVLDVLPIGVYFLNQGNQRDSLSFSWEPKSVNIWDPLPATYADANGDGIINELDIIGIGVNWGNTCTNSSKSLVMNPSDTTLLRKYKKNFLIIYNSLSGESAAVKAMRSLLESALNIRESVPLNFTLYQNYPNPFNPKTNISFAIPKDQQVTLTIYNVLGQVISVPIKKQFYKTGKYSYNFDASLFPSGIYIYKIKTEYFNASRKMAVIK
jgi:hypothetical protein